MIEPNQLQKRANWLLAVAWMILIFGFSAQNNVESNAMSDGVVGFLALFIQKTGWDVDVHMLTVIVRKSAHFLLFTVLGFLVSRGICPSLPFRKKDILIIIGICFLYAMSDEMHQLFSVGRSCELRDMLIDTGGATFGVLLRIAGQRMMIKKV